MIEIRFGTAAPFSFREIDRSIDLDMEIHARLNGTAMVEDYDKALYDNEDKVKEAIRLNINAIITRCLNDKWDKELSVLAGWPDLLGPMMDQEFEGIGITAVTHINSIAVLPEDEEKMSALRKEKSFTSPYTSIDWVDKTSFERHLKEYIDMTSWCCPRCKTQNTGGFCSGCGEQKTYH